MSGVDDDDEWSRAEVTLKPVSVRNSLTIYNTHETIFLIGSIQDEKPLGFRDQHYLLQSKQQQLLPSKQYNSS